MMTGIATVHKKFMSAVIYFLRRAGRPLIFHPYIFRGEKREREREREREGESRVALKL